MGFYFGLDSLCLSLCVCVVLAGRYNGAIVQWCKRTLNVGPDSRSSTISEPQGQFSKHNSDTHFIKNVLCASYIDNVCIN